jgi:HlyD family secretion protein
MKKTKKFVFLVALVIIIILVAVYFLSSNRDTVTYRTTKVVKENIVQTVSETGTVKSANEIDLSFLSSGKFKSINYKIGESIEKGDIIAMLDISNLEIKKQEAQANLDVAKGNLSKLLAGATSEEIAVAKASANQAKSAYESSKIDFEKTENLVKENIDQAQKTLSDLQLDTPETLTTYEQSIKSAQTSLNNTKSKYQRSIDNYKDKALVAVDDSIAKANTALDTVDRILTDTNGKDYLSAKDNTILENSRKSYNSGLSYLNNARNTLAIAKDNSSTENVLESINKAISALDTVFSALQDCFQALEYSIVSSQFTQTIIDTHKTSVSSDLTIISTALSSLQTAKQNLNDSILDYNTNVSTAEDSLATAQAAYDNAVITAENALKTTNISGDQTLATAQSKIDSSYEAWRVAVSQLEKITAPANKHDIDLAQAKIRQAQSALDSIINQIDNNILTAPIDGTITKVEFEIGEQITAGVPVVSILGIKNFEIEVLISEADIAKIKLKNKSEITLDAFGDDTKFNGVVDFIEPAETVIQDVIYYKVLVNFNSENRDVKSGMTANVVITTAKKNNALVVPSRAIIEKNGQGKFVRLLVNNQIEEKNVTLGLRGDEGLVELIGGINENDIIVLSIDEE